MNTQLLIEDGRPGALQCTLDVLGLGRGNGLIFTLELPKDSRRTTSELEFELLTKARDLLNEMCAQHPANKSA